MSWAVLFYTSKNNFIMEIFIIYLASTTVTVTSITMAITTSSTTSTTAPAFCANTCTMNSIINTNITTCGLVCIDIGAYLCQPNSILCVGGSCSAASCCIYNTFDSVNPFLSYLSLWLTVGFPSKRLICIYWKINKTTVQTLVTCVCLLNLTYFKVRKFSFLILCSLSCCFFNKGTLLLSILLKRILYYFLNSFDVE